MSKHTFRVTMYVEVETDRPLPYVAESMAQDLKAMLALTPVLPSEDRHTIVSVAVTRVDQ